MRLGERLVVGKQELTSEPFLASLNSLKFDLICIIFFIKDFIVALLLCISLVLQVVVLVVQVVGLNFRL